MRQGVACLDSGSGLVPRALRDITAGVEAGRFHVASPKLAVAAVAGALLGTLHLSLTDPDFAEETAFDQLAEQLLCLLGIPLAEARQLATAPLPELTAEDPAPASGGSVRAHRPG